MLVWLILIYTHVREFWFRPWRHRQKSGTANPVRACRLLSCDLFPAKFHLYFLCCACVLSFTTWQRSQEDIISFCRLKKNSKIWNKILWELCSPASWSFPSFEFTRYFNMPTGGAGKRPNPSSSQSVCVIRIAACNPKIILQLYYKEDPDKKNGTATQVDRRGDWRAEGFVQKMLSAR